MKCRANVPLARRGRAASRQAGSRPTGNHTRLLATSGDTTIKLWLTEKAAGAARVEMLSFSTYFPAAWLHFGRDADGSDRSLLHAQPFCPLEIWPGSRSPVIATPPDRISPLKVLRAP